jgi:aryl-alcohol dehydrogenase-like predicted oxidoreductase
MITNNRIGLGTFPLAGVYNSISKEGAEKVVNTFLNNGGYYIDTAPMYGSGSVETLLGTILKNKPRNSYYIISKCGKSILPDQSVVKKASYMDVIQQCNESLERLQLNYLDLYLIHSPDKTTPYADTIKALNMLKKQGKIKEFGVSNVSLDELKKYRTYADIRFVQNRFSFINRSISSEFLDYMRTNDIQLLPYHVLEVAQLTGTVLEEESLGVSDFRNTYNYFKPKAVIEIRNWVQKSLLPIAKKYGCTIGQLAITWVLAQAQTPFLFVGTTKPSYVEIDLKCNSLQLTPEIKEKLEEAYTKLQNDIHTKYQTSIKNFRGLNDKFY